MIEIRRILCPTDFSSFAERALRQALTVARWYESSLSVLHVVPPVVPVDGMLPYTLQTLGNPSLRTRLERELAEFAAPARAAGVPTDTLLREGVLTAKILELARDLPADLLVMGTHGQGGLERLVLGSVTESVLRRAPCPVLTIPHEEPASAGPAPFKRILYATDFSPPADDALDYALSLAEEAQGTLVLVHVMEGPTLRATTSGLPLNVSPLTADLAEDARRSLRKAVPSSARDWCTTEEVIAFGRPAAEIMRVAREREAEVIVMGVHGRNALDLLLFGSTTNHVIRAAPCPVLTIPGPTAAERPLAVRARR
jgi:nucleotide-binding universal stress UspA family protein